MHSVFRPTGCKPNVGSPIPVSGIRTGKYCKQKNDRHCLLRTVPAIPPQAYRCSLSGVNIPAFPPHTTGEAIRKDLRTLKNCKEKLAPPLPSLQAFFISLCATVASSARGRATSYTCCTRNPCPKPREPPSHRRLRRVPRISLIISTFDGKSPVVTGCPPPQRKGPFLPFTRCNYSAHNNKEAVTVGEGSGRHVPHPSHADRGGQLPEACSTLQKTTKNNKNMAFIVHPSLSTLGFLNQA